MQRDTYSKTEQKREKVIDVTWLTTKNILWTLYR